MRDYILKQKYQRWYMMLSRCRGDKQGYEDCHVCDSWLSFGNFRDWMDDQEWKGKELDKDVMFFGNRVYSPLNCLFVPKHINCLFRGQIESTWPRGVVYRNGRYMVVDYVNGEKISHPERFDDPLEAHIHWVRKRAQTIVSFAESESGVIRDAMLFRAIRLFECADHKMIVNQI